jgi:hypothetical protein
VELNKQLQAEITEIFRGVQYGRISFFLSPEKKTLDYSIEVTGKLLIIPQETSQKSLDKNKKRP